MATIESPIGSVVSSGKPMKTFVVDDPTIDEPVVNPYYKPQQQQQQQQQQKQEIVEQVENQKPTEEEIFRQYQEAKKAKKRISPENKQKIEALLGLRQIIKHIKIDDVIITMKNLNANDARLALKTIAINAQTNIDLSFYTRNVYVALSLYEINGEKLSDIFNEEEEIDLELRLSTVEEMSEDVIKTLYDFYEREIGIKLPITDEAAKEVKAEIKK